MSPTKPSSKTDAFLNTAGPTKNGPKEGQKAGKVSAKVRTPFCGRGAVCFGNSNRNFTFAEKAWPDKIPTAICVRMTVAAFGSDSINDKKATSPSVEWSPLLFKVLEDVVESLINGGFQTLADDVIQHLLEDAFLLLPLLLFLVAHFFTLLSITRLMGSSSSSFWCLDL